MQLIHKPGFPSPGQSVAGLFPRYDNFQKKILKKRLKKNKKRIKKLIYKIRKNRRKRWKRIVEEGRIEGRRVTSFGKTERTVREKRERRGEEIEKGTYFSVIVFKQLVLPRKKLVSKISNCHHENLPELAFG
jgi:hypothetical protein